jgi:glycosyltransferase involved in cell wall biosynthesis
MRGTRTAEGAGSIARVWRAEGFAAVRDRVWDRIREASVRARCVRGGDGPWPSASILNVIGVPMTTVFGGVPLQLRARLRHESMMRPVALLSREPGAPSSSSHGRGAGAAGWRLEAWSGGRPRRAMTFPAEHGDRIDAANAAEAARGAGAGVGARLGGGAAAGDWDGDPLREDPAWLHAVLTSIRLVNARAVHVENAAGLSLVSLSSLMGIDGSDIGGGIDASIDGKRLPVVLSIHDLSLFSRHPHGLPTPAAADGDVAPQSSGDRRVADRAASHEALVADRQRFEHAFHHALGTGIVRAAAFTIYPSQFMRHRIEALPHLPAHVIAPGIEPPAGTRARVSRSARRPDQIALLGGGQEHKGGPRLARIAAALAARGMRVTSYGGYGHEYLLQMRGIRGVRVRGYYRAGSLPEQLARQGASVALILSAVPESFSLVLSEAWAAGVPVIAPASGAFVERLRASDVSNAPAAAGGLLLSANPSDEEILAAVDRARGMRWDMLPAPPAATQAAERHLALYRSAGFITAAGA